MSTSAAAVALSRDIGDQRADRAVEAADVVGERRRPGITGGRSAAGEVGEAGDALGDVREAGPVAVGPVWP